MKLLDRIRTLGQELMAATSALTTNLADIRQQMKAKRDELQHATNAPRPPGEVIPRFNAWIDEEAANYRRREAAGLVIQRFGRRPGPLEPGHYANGAPFGGDTSVKWGELAFFCGDQLQAKFAELVRATPYTPGPPEAERAAVIERLTRELQAIEAQEETLIDDMCAQGITVQHRAEVIERRANDAARRVRAEQAVADRRAREQVINTRHAARAVVHSAYIYGAAAGTDVRSSSR